MSTAASSSSSCGSCSPARLWAGGRSYFRTHSRANWMNSPILCRLAKSVPLWFHSQASPALEPPAPAGGQAVKRGSSRDVFFHPVRLGAV